MLERLDELKKITVKNFLVNATLERIGDSYYYNKYQLESFLALTIFTLFGDKEIHQEMNQKDVDWISFMDKNYKLIEDLKNGDYKEIYNEIFSEITEGAKNKAKYNRTFMSLMDKIGNIFNEDTIKLFKENLEKQLGNNVITNNNDNDNNN